MNTNTLQGKRVAILVADGFEQVELTRPREALDAAGARTSIVSPAAKVQGWNHFEKADHFTVDVQLNDAKADDFDALLLPGGVANPDQLRTDEAARRLVKAAADAGTPIAVICHGPWTLIDAGVVSGRTLTSWPSLRTDLTNAGATWVDEEVVVDTTGAGPLITSRNPDDLDAFNRKMVEEIGEGPHAGQTA